MPLEHRKCLSLSEQKEPISDEIHKQIGIETNNAIWPILDKKKATKDELDEAMHMAYTSRYHWSKVGTIVNAVRAEYMIARVYSKMKRSEPALYHAKKALKLANKAKKEDSNWQDWDMPFIYEVLARAHAVAGNKEECMKYYERAQKAISKVKDEEDKKICQGELDQVRCPK
jgi:tetratricopeptide (TPR) repeat protein